jgi:hypothetical protein
MTFCWYCNKTVDIGETLFTVRKAVVNPDGRWQLMSRITLGDNEKLKLLPEDDNTETVLLCSKRCINDYYTRKD